MSILVYISGRSCFSGITTYNIPTFLTLVLIKGGLISQKNVGTATLRWGGAYKPGGLIGKGGLINQFIRYSVLGSANTTQSSEP